MSNHTPTPWDYEGAEDCCRIVSYVDPKMEEIAVRLREDDAEFIVRAVNNHQAMLDTLRIVARGSCLRQINTENKCICYPCIAQRAIDHAEAQP